MPRPLLAALLAVALVAPAPTGLVLAGAPQPEPTDTTRRVRTERRIREQRQAGEYAALVAELPGLFQRHTDWLADPVREGRAPGTRGIDEAADYIEDALLALGLEPAFADASPDETVPLPASSPYRQPLPVGDQVEALDSRVSFALPDGRILTPSDINVSAYSGTSAFAGPCTFAGYAVVTGGGGYLGFTGTEDFTGRSILMLSHEPMDELGRSLWSDRGWSFAAPLHRKINAVRRRGAGAVFVVEPPDLDEATTGSPDPAGRAREHMEPFDIPVVWIPPDVADRLLRAGDPESRGLSALYRLANRQGVVVELAGVAAAVQTSVLIRTITSDNVGAVLPGRGELAEQLIVIGAHYDHLGRLVPGAEGPVTPAPSDSGQVHPGADDNASGTAGLILAAELLTRRYDALPDDTPARSVLFLAFTAEEMGLVGSRFYVDHPVAPIDQHVLMLNMDMIGRCAFHGLEMGGTETADSLPSLIDPRVLASGLDARPLDSIGMDRSDQASFIDRRVPSLCFFTGLHDEYHTPFDTPDLLDERGAAAIAELVADIAFDAATSTERPVWSGRVGGTPRDPTKDDGRPKVRSGIVPAARAPGEGMLVARVLEGSPASDAGLRPGDRITSWNGNPVTGPEDWMPLLLEHRPGDIVRVEFIRAGQTRSAEVILQGAESGG